MNGYKWSLYGREYDLSQLPSSFPLPERSLVLEHNYPHGGEVKAKCYIDMYDLPNGTVVILTEPPDNPGMSVTNAVEWIASLLADLYPECRRFRCVWIEHYPNRHPQGMEQDRTFDESFDLVLFTWDDLTATAPTWKRLPRQKVLELVEGCLWFQGLIPVCPHCGQPWQWREWWSPAANLYEEWRAQKRRCAGLMPPLPEHPLRDILGPAPADSGEENDDEEDDEDNGDW